MAVKLHVTRKPELSLKIQPETVWVYARSLHPCYTTELFISLSLSGIGEYWTQRCGVSLTLRCLHPWGVAVTGKGTKAEAFSRALAAESSGRDIWRHKLISSECFQKYCDKFLRAVSTYLIKVSDFFRELLLLFIFIDFF